VADIHFDYRLALESIDSGADKIRINPGNIGDDDRVRQVVAKSKEWNIPIRIGINAGSLHKEILKKYDGVTAKGMVESAVKNAELIEKYLYDNIVFSLKASSVVLTIQAYMEMSKVTDYPLHVGVTEAGTIKAGTIKSSVGIGTILAAGIGDTIRVSLTGDPVNEIGVAREILKSLNMLNDGPELISCPTCGRCKINLISIAEQVEERLKSVKKNVKVAVMGCAVNGPGEAKEADIGIAGGDNEGLLFKKGKIIRKIQSENIVNELIKEIENI
jgi:(E)-4-hydroxy-3-methylbut-2-enyl-diphosphate synthase